MTQLERDENRSNGDREGIALPLPRLRGRAGVGVPPRVALFEWREFPPPASHHSMRHSRSFASASLKRRPPKAAYAPPQAGEVKRVCGPADSTKNRHGLGVERLAPHI